jgi:flagellar operon protein
VVINNQFSIRPLGGKSETPSAKVSNTSNQQGLKAKGFDSILKEKLDESKTLKFSKHAQGRLETRNIRLTEQQNQRLGEGVRKAQEKGVRDSLILCDNLAFVVSIKNQTVVTALNGEELKSNVFTNIDGAVIV